ncbi:MAG TPA: nucleoside recognition domain-containing protein, partial [Candidatus Hodarchaeales archaeon]|nr:nucleoside recognition domain-containing protein [Candidatus Hodarchaeales archaeon]
IIAAFVIFLIASFVQSVIRGLIGSLSSSGTQILQGLGIHPLIISLMVSESGIFGALSTIFQLLPVVFLFFVLMSYSERSGLFPRIADKLNTLLGKIGLQGEIFFPLTLSLGCNVVGARAFGFEKNGSLRAVYVCLNSYVPCSARIVVVASLLSLITPNAVVSAILLFTFIVVGYGLVLSQAALFTRLLGRGDVQLLSQLPSFEIPSFNGVVSMAWTQTSSFISKATKIIIPGTVVIWFFSLGGDSSILGYLGRSLNVIFFPIGFDWQMTLALIFGFVAKENTLATLQTLYGGLNQLASSTTYPTMVAFVTFFAFYVPCLPTVIAIKNEVHSWRKTMLAVILNVATAYLLAAIAFVLTIIILTMI